MGQAIIGERDTLYAALAGGLPERPVSDLLFDVAAAFDMKSASFLLMPSRTDHTLSRLVLLSSLPPDFWERVDQLCPPSSCQLFNAARGSLVPVTWSLDEMRRQNLLIHGVEPASVPLYRQFGISHGIVIPVSSVDGTRHALRFDGDRAPLTQAEINDLAMLAAHFVQTYDQSRHPLGDPTGLTDRELEVVQWSATGKTSLEIAAVMSLSDHTINAYMNNALKKLNCTSRTQLVAKALRMRLIS
jgi:DNA-binding CsgD family transcriptional regulator